MTDIVERLREYQDHVPYDVADWLDPLRADAADEIERLRAALEDILAGCDKAIGAIKGTAREALTSRERDPTLKAE